MKPLRIFVIQPYSAPHSTKFRELIKDVCDESRGRFLSFRADDVHASSSYSRLQDRIDSCLKRADLCIADMTGVTNHNVLLEVGAAYTLNVPVIPVADKDLPSDIRGNLRIELNSAQIENSDEQERFKTELTRRLIEAEAEIGRHNSVQFIAYGYPSRIDIDFFDLVERCESRIDVLTTNLNFFVNRKLVSKFDPRNTASLLELIAKAMPTKPETFELRILALDPDSNFTNDRAIGLGRNRQEFREQLRKDLQELVAFASSSRCVRSLKVKTYQALPTQVTYFFDDVLVSSVVSTERSTRDCIHYVHSIQSGGVQETYGREFEYFWGRGELRKLNGGS